MRRCLALLAAGSLFAAALAGCGASGTIPYAGEGDGSSGVHGVALVGPVAPVSHPGDPNTQPLAGAIITFQLAEGGLEVARTTADSTGHFRIALKPQTYSLVPLPPNPGSSLPSGQPQKVRVVQGTYTQVTVNYDSGIR